MTVATSNASWCPPWCVTAHDPSQGEDDWLHLSEPLVLADGVVARLGMSIDPTTGEQDGPYVFLGDEQLEPAEAERLGVELTALATLGQRPPDPDAAA
ncbi:DUF6907 domain-containing protein [Ornithinimicrobium cerasi]|uniref:Uncharacterized protein n=1 Tax=Ornithinimicrobium cerasi TaxID=2248773 RepID=A0A285VD00_9MICO|nr:hypothetical protein [Ornithinimicrobium cerasi]SOC52005.1 hypothetical protein SAMN05421879_101382 [Ornithinimicrobium cerasi]